MMKTIFKLTVVAAALVSVSAFAASNNPTPTKYDTLQDIAIQSNKHFNDYQQGKIVQNESDIRDLQNETTRQFDQLNTYVKSVDQARADGDAALGQRIETLEKAPKPLDGKDGINGHDGKDGRDGVDGKDGAAGATGAVGAKGDKGDAGAAGTNGLNGKDGIDGKNGKDADMTLVNKNTSDIKSLSIDVTANAARAADLDNRIAQQKVEQAKTNATVAGHTKQLADHEKRINSLESQTNSRFSDLDKRIGDNKRNADAGIAGVAAMANIPQVTEYQSFAVGAGVGSREGESAVAVGVSFRASQNVVVKATVAGDTQQSWTVGAGVSYGW